MVCIASGFSLFVALSLLIIYHGLVSEMGPDLVFKKTLDWIPLGGEGLVGVGWLLDGVSAPMLVVVGLVAFCVQLYSLGYLDDESPEALGRYFTWQALFVVVMQAMVLAPNLLQLFMGWELVGLCSYLLIGFWWQKPEASRAAVKAFWVTKFADGGLLLGLVILAAATGGFGWQTGGLSENQLVVITLLLFLGVMGKSAQVPLHIWLPDAMQGPTPVSALLHAATMVAAGVYMVVRAWPLFEAAELTLQVMCWVGAITAFVAACLALLQDDVKKLLAFSTCSQLGYMVAALGAGSMAAGYFHLTTHAFFKALLFLAAGVLIHAMGTNNMSKMGGLAKKMPLTAVLFTLGALALAGVPPLSGFYSKDLVLEGLHHDHQWVPLGLAMVTVALTGAYMGRAVVKIFGGPPGDEAGHAHEGPPVMGIPNLVLGVFTLVAGFLFVGPFHTLLGLEAGFHMTPLGMVALGLAVLGLLVGGWMARGGRVPGVAGLSGFLRTAPMDRLFVGAYQWVLLGLARGVAWVDRYVVDGFINAVGWALIACSERARQLQTGRADQYIWAVAMGALAILVYTTWGV
jgi:NADH-quinone oxidoreductase subunit L